MSPAAQRCRRRLSEDDAYSRFSEMFDLDVFALEIEYGDHVGAVIHEGVEKTLDRKQRAFDAMLAAHPATIAEENLRVLARQLEEERMQRIAKRKDRKRPTRARRSAQQWQSKLASVQAS